MLDSDGNRLVQIQIIHRHGARAPVYGKTFPSICGPLAYRPFQTFIPRLPLDADLHPSTPKPLSPHNAASCYSGQLTPLGAAQMFALGARLRARYATFLPDVFDPRLVLVRSTALRRTVESAVAMLSGMYPVPSGASAARMRTLDIDVRPRPMENMLGLKRSCNRLFELRKAAHAQASFAFPAVLQAAEGIWLKGVEVKNISQAAVALRDIAVALRENGLTPQEWENVAEPLGVKQIMRVYCWESWGLALGQFVDELLKEAASHKTNEWRCKVYSAHDATILPMMGCFEDEARHGVPEFAEDVVLETWVNPHNDNEPKVRLKYSGDDIIIRGCEQYGPLCPISVVRKAVAKHIPVDLDRACGGALVPRSGSGSKVDTEAVEHKQPSAPEGSSF